MSTGSHGRPRYVVPIRKEQMPVKPIIPTDSSCIKVCKTLNDEIDRLAKTVKTIEEQSEIYGSKRATRIVAHKMNILEDFRNELIRKSSCKCMEV